MHFEPKVLRAEPLLNPALSDDERRFDSEYSLYVSCAWRLETTETVLCSSGDGVADPDRMATNLERLPGQHLINVMVSPPGWDAALTFEEGVRLHVFCDQSGDHDNYAYFTATEVLAVAAHSRIVSESR